MAVNETVERIVYEGVDRISSVAKSAETSNVRLRQSIDAVKGALAAVGVTVGAGALVALYHDTLKATGALDDMNEVSGSSVESLSAIQRVAKVGSHDFDGFAGQIGRTVKGLREGTEEGGRAAQAFAFLGIRTREADGRFRDWGEVVIELAQKLTKYQDGGNKVALVQDALGKGAERYLPLLKDIAEGTDLHATTTAKQAAAAEAAEKNIRRLTLSYEDSRRELVNEYTPALIRFTDQLLAASKASGNFWMNFLSIGGKQAADPLKALAEVEGRLARLRADAATLGGSGIAAKFNRMMAPEDLAILHRQIEFAERQRAVLQELLQRQVAGNARGLVEDASGNVGPAPAPARLTYNPGGGFSAEDVRRRQQEVIEASIRANNQRDEIQKALNPFHMTEAEKEKAGAAWVKNIIELRDDVNAKIARQIVEPTMDDEGLDPVRDARLRSLQDSLVTEEQLAREAHARQMALFEEFSTEQFTAYGGRQAVIEGMQAQHQERLLDIERRKHQATRSMEQGTLQLTAGFLAQFAGKSKAAALGVIAINKALMIAQTIQSTAAAVMRAYADLGPVAGTPAAAWIKTLGAIQIGLIGATGLAEAANLGGGPSAVPTFNAIPGTNIPAETPAQAAAAPAAAPVREATVIIQTNSRLHREVYEELADNMGQLFGDGFVVKGLKVVSV